MGVLALLSCKLLLYQKHFCCSQGQKNPSTLLAVPKLGPWSQPVLSSSQLCVFKEATLSYLPHNLEKY